MDITWTKEEAGGIGGWTSVNDNQNINKIRKNIGITISDKYKKGEMIQPLKGKTYKKVYGIKKAEEIGNKISNSKVGVKLLKEHCKNISIGRLGKEPWNKGLTKELDNRIEKMIKKLSETSKRKYQSGELIIWNKGLTKETHKSLKIISEKNKIWERTEEYRKNMSIACSGEKNGFYGKKHTKEVCNKMSLAKKGIIPHNKINVDVEMLIQLYMKGLTAKQIAKEMNINYKIVNSRLKDLNFPTNFHSFEGKKQIKEFMDNYKKNN